MAATEPLSCNDLAEVRNTGDGRENVAAESFNKQEPEQPTNKLATKSFNKQKHVEIQPTNKLEQLIQPTNEHEQQQLLQPPPSVLVREPETAGPETPHPSPSLWASNEQRPAAPDPPPQALVAMERTPNAPDPSIFSDDTGTATATNTTATIVFSDRHEATPAKLQKGQTRATGRPDYGRTPT
ncbi:Os02g0585000 [Oryza sativa Japonica Group]|jgi:hypothetical protein|uniref:Os02g0585000 protein n=2 Tax=Oryza sativa subsp. japonica TaxID=39947 RepID=A3A8F7_ORYSJ|nr:hypothetical protein OsJ_07295 [Oryza sativa Japonica Group]BAS79454.1 Os02g0585000 [Oryza sativa Japonica Group]